MAKQLEVNIVVIKENLHKVDKKVCCIVIYLKNCLIIFDLKFVTYAAI
ncbi:hypothetical protein J503_2406 [Acinetobacter baumannii 984213]|nr:hypothetical protein J503_2406 [Acinetobacter baumannii 984213]KCY24308.1 hypothetical protein J635_0467 [Acinetobacter baumannii 233846]QCR58591.1 hypothetical protein D1G37_16798 [Acinetobacter baumannii]